MSVNAWFSPLRSFRKFQDNQQLFNGLADLDNRAILYLQAKSAPMVRKLTKRMGLDREQSEEILNQSTLVFLQKIESGAYTFKGHAPTTYLVEVAKRLAMAKVRRKKPASLTLEDHHQQKSEYEEVKRLEASADLVHCLLGQLSDVCAHVIRLHHIDGYSDAEVIEGDFTAYSTINSLKMKRSTCMKKLIEIAQQWKTSKNT
jgi:DNA-directed RNA polymerase specialized sigma24 family protein